MYVDGFLVPVPLAKIDEYVRVAEIAREVYLDHGAVSFVEAEADDVKDGKQTDFFRAVDRREGETVFFSFITYRDRAHRDEVNAMAMADPRLKMPPHDHPFDAKRMVWGGFRARVVG